MVCSQENQPMYVMQLAEVKTSLTTRCNTDSHSASCTWQNRIEQEIQTVAQSTPELDVKMNKLVKLLKGIQIK